MKHVILLPERYRIGDVISFKVRRVPGIQADRLTVCCAPNQRFLYPTATDFVDVDEGLNGHGEREVTAALKAQYPQAECIKLAWKDKADDEFQIEVSPQPCLVTDVLICPRKKDNSSPHRNWTGWQELCLNLQKSGNIVAAIGRDQDSEDLGLVSRIKDLEAIAAHMLKTRLVVATDSGLAHLAILLRVPLVVIWGTPVGVIPGQPYEKGCHARMEHQKRSPVWHIEGGWESPAKAFNEVNKILCTL